MHLRGIQSDAELQTARESRIVTRGGSSNRLSQTRTALLDRGLGQGRTKGGPRGRELRVNNSASKSGTKELQRLGAARTKNAAAGSKTPAGFTNEAWRSVLLDNAESQQELCCLIAQQTRGGKIQLCPMLKVKTEGTKLSTPSLRNYPAAFSFRKSGAPAYCPVLPVPEVR